MITCPLCGREDCDHTPEDLGLTHSEFIIYLELERDKDLSEAPAIKPELQKIREKIKKSCLAAKR